MDQSQLRKRIPTAQIQLSLSNCFEIVPLSFNNYEESRIPPDWKAYLVNLVAFTLVVGPAHLLLH